MIDPQRQHEFLHRRTWDIVRAVATFWETHGYGPNVREIGEMVGLSSSSTVQNHINTAVTYGWLIQGPQNMARTVRLPASQMVRRSELVTCQGQLRDLQEELVAARAEITRLKNGSGQPV